MCVIVVIVTGCVYDVCVSADICSKRYGVGVWVFSNSNRVPHNALHNALHKALHITYITCNIVTC